MSLHFKKRRKTTDQGKATALATAGVPTIDSLPPELLETICGLLDVRTLCTARLVCALFHAAASRCLQSVELSVEDLRSRPETNLNNFPNLSRVSVCEVTKRDLLMLAQSPIADAVTHLRAVDSARGMPRRGRSAARLALLPLPNLVSLTESRTPSRACSFPHTLRELIFERPVTYQEAKLVTSLTNLTSLRIDVQALSKPFKAVSALTALQKLEICSDLSVASFVAELTLLTHLQIMENLLVSMALASFSRLRRLVHLGVGRLTARLEHELLRSIGTITSLRSLDLQLCELPERSAFETVCMTPFSQLTALSLDSLGLDAAFLPRFNLEGLQDLSLSSRVELDSDGVAALRRATGLTHLQLRSTTVGTSVGTEELEIALSHMSRLRALSLGTYATPETRICPEAIGLTGLTKLEWGGRGVTRNSALKACLGLKKLQVLNFFTWGAYVSAPYLTTVWLTPAVLSALAMLPELRTFEVNGKFQVLGCDLEEFLKDILARLNADRHEKGWPPLKLNMEPNTMFGFTA